MNKVIAVIVKGYPRLSETFIAQEIKSLEENGFQLLIVSLRHPTDLKTHPVHKKIKAKIHYLPEYLHHEVVRVIKAIANVIIRIGFWKVLFIWLKDLLRDFTRNRIRRFGQAIVLVSELGENINFFYVHFLHTPASVTRYASMISSVPWGGSAHAVDIWTSPEWELREKIKSCNWLTTCTQYNYNYLKSLSVDRNRIYLMYHGIDFGKFPLFDKKFNLSNGKQGQEAVKIVSVGRLVKKKGYDILLTALSEMNHELYWEFEHLGGGELELELKSLAKELEIEHRITWRGPVAQAEVLDAYRKADIFVLACRITGNNDRDGLPNVLLEALSQKLAVVATDISGIPELIINKQTGLLVKQNDIEGLTEKISGLITDPELRKELAMSGYNSLKAKFSHANCIKTLVKLLEKEIN